MKRLNHLFLSLLIIGLMGCNDNEKIDLPDITVNFQATEIGMDADGQAEITLVLSRATPAVLSATIGIESDDVDYFTDYGTVPTALNQEIVVSFAAESTTTSFSVYKNEDSFF